MTGIKGSSYPSFASALHSHKLGQRNGSDRLKGNLRAYTCAADQHRFLIRRLSFKALQKAIASVEGSDRPNQRSSWSETCNALIHVSKCARGAQIPRLKLLDMKTRFFDQSVDLAVQMTSPAQALPERRKAVLPPHDREIGSKAMLDKQQAAIAAQNTSHFSKGAGRIGDGAQRPGCDDCMEASCLKRRRFCQTSNQKGFFRLLSDRAASSPAEGSMP